MDRLEQYREAIQKTLDRHLEIAEQNSDRSNGQTYTLRDAKTDSFFLLATEVRNYQRVYGVLLHLRLADDKIVVEANNVQDFIEDLIDLGIPEADFVLPDHEMAAIAF